MAQLIQTAGSGDGVVYRDGGASWAATRGATSGTAISNETENNVYGSKLGAQWYVGRLFFPFDLSTIPGGSTIDSATFDFDVVTKYGQNSPLHVIQTSQASTSSLTANDFDNVTFTSGGSVTVTAAGAYQITLNATALGWLTSAIGSTVKLGLMEDHDLTNTDPAPNDYRFRVYMSEDGTASNRPVLTVNYTSGGGGGAAPVTRSIMTTNTSFWGS